MADHVFHYKHGWVKIGGDAPSGRSADKLAANVVRPKNAETCENCDHGSGLITNVDHDDVTDKPVVETSVCDLCDGHGWIVPDKKTLAARAKNEAMNARLRENGIPGFTWTGTKWVKNS